MKFRFPGLKKLDIYIMRQFLGTYIFSIAVFIIVIVVFDTVEKIDNFIKYDAPLSEILFGYYLNFIPFFINQFSGLFTFISVIFFTSKLAYKTEIIAILSSGVSFKRFLWPYFLSALLITISSLVLSLTFIPNANEKRIAFENVYVRPQANNKFEPNIYRQLEPGTFIYIRNFSESKGNASFLVVEKFEQNAMVESIEASKVTFDSDSSRWKADKYVVRTFDGEDETFEIKENLDTVLNLTADELGRVDQLIQTMGIERLNSFIKQQKIKGSDMIEVFEVEKHKRYSYPFSTFILTLIGVSLSSRKVRGGTGLHIGIGVGLCFSYILFARFAEEFAKSGALSTGLSVWIPNILFSIVAIYLYIRAPK